MRARAKAALRRGQRAAANIMTATCRIERPTGETVTDPNTGEVTRTMDLVYEGRCKVQSSIPKAAEEDAGGKRYVIENLSIHLPIGSQVLIDDEITVTAETMDPDLVGLTFRAVEMPRGSFRTADRWAVELVVK